MSDGVLRMLPMYALPAPPPWLPPMTQSLPGEPALPGPLPKPAPPTELTLASFARVLPRVLLLLTYSCPPNPTEERE